MKEATDAVYTMTERQAEVFDLVAHAHAYVCAMSISEIAAALETTYNNANLLVKHMEDRGVVRLKVLKRPEGIVTTVEPINPPGLVAPKFGSSDIKPNVVMIKRDDIPL